MAIIQVTAFIILTLLLAYLWQERFVSVLPSAVCCLVLTLYVLALCGHLSLIDYLGAVMFTGVCLWLIIGKKKEVLLYWRSVVSEPSFWASLAMVCIVAFCVSGKLVTWWDDINFWATDAKSLYYLDGFAKKYGNVAPEFGDYPPATQLFKWWFLHLDRHTFREGLAFAGYHVMNLAFLFPLFPRGKKGGKPGTVLSFILMAAALWLFPGIAEVYGYHGFCADLTMACIYGNFLYAVTDRECRSESFYRARLLLYLSTLVLVKSVGFLWAFFGLVFFFLYRFCLCRKQTTLPDGTAKNLPGAKYMAAIIAAPCLSGGSWMLFCLLMRRVTKTTATAVKYLTTDEYTWSLYRHEFTKAFVKAFFMEPLHKERGWGFDLTPFIFYLCICILVFFYTRKRILSKEQGTLVLCFSMVSGAVMYAIIYLSHLTIFANETQYLEAAAMVSSMERYGAPFTVGTLLFLSLLWMERGGALFARYHAVIAEYGAVLCFTAFVLLTTGWQNSYDGLIGYRSQTAQDAAERTAMTDARSERFRSAVQCLGTQQSTRVLYLQSDEAERWVRNSYTNFLVSPVSVVYRQADLSGGADAFLTDLVRASHAAYLYTDQPDAAAEAFVTDAPGQNGFRAQTLYQIEDDGIKIRLKEMTEPKEE